MNPYIGSLILGVIGLSVMALGGLDHHGGATPGGHGHGDGGGHAGNGHGAGQHGHDGSHGHATHQSSSVSALGMLLMSPRLLFSWLIGVGLVGILLRDVLDGLLLAAAAAVGGVVFERLVVSPLWKLTLRFASNPALTLESALDSEAKAVSSFDVNGNGLVALEVDGQVVQLLGTLTVADRERGVRVRSGESVRVEEIDSERNRCIVSRM